MKEMIYLRTLINADTSYAPQSYSVKSQVFFELIYAHKLKKFFEKLKIFTRLMFGKSGNIDLVFNDTIILRQFLLFPFFVLSA